MNLQQDYVQPQVIVTNRGGYVPTLEFCGGKCLPAPHPWTIRLLSLQVSSRHNNYTVHDRNPNPKLQPPPVV